MSLQAGVWQFNARHADRGLLAGISMAAAQCEPNGFNEYITGPVCMFYWPFHTTRESRLEIQPYRSPNGSVVMWDGRLDNRKDLSVLLGQDLTDERTDVAIAAAAFDRWGVKAFEKLLGDWALSIWNPIQKTLVLACDCVGIRHLYYCATHEKIVWCTHLASLVRAAGVPLTIDDDYVAGYLALYPETHLTPYREIKSVPPATFVRLQPGKAVTNQYWALDPHQRIIYGSDREYEEHFWHAFREAVRRRLRGDLPILAQLSGGIDSSSIVCMADDLISAGEAETPRVDTVSYFDPQEPGGDERSYISIIEQKRGRIGRHIDVGNFKMTFSLEDNRVFFPVPGALGGTERNDDANSSFRKQGIRVVLSGVGGDEFMGGVPDPRPQLADLLLQLRLRQFTSQLMAWSLVKRRPWLHLLLEVFIFLMPPSLRSHFALEARVPDWIDNIFATKHRLARLQLGPQDNFGFELPSSKNHAQTFVALTRQLAYCQPENDGWIEHRYPFLDRDLLEFVVAIPANQLLKPSERRSLMRRALVKLVPLEVLSRGTKGTGGSSHMRAFRENGAQLEQLLSSSIASSLGYIRKDTFKQTLASVKNGDLAPLVRLTRGLGLELWLRHLVTHGVIRLRGDKSLPLGDNLPISEGLTATDNKEACFVQSPGVPS